VRILYVTNGFPFPLTSGYLRHYFFIRELAQNHEITLLSLVRSGHRPEHAEALRPFVKELHVFASGRKSPPARRMLQRMQPRFADMDAPSRMAATVSRLVAANRYDVALFSGKQTFPVVKRLGDLPFVADMCDATSLRIRTTTSYSTVGRWPALWAKYLHLRYIETQLTRKAAHVLFASCRDRDAILGGPADRATIAPNGVDLDFWQRTGPHSSRPCVAFTGAMDYPPNADAAGYLIDEIFPRLQKLVPHAELLIVGRDPGPRLIAAGQRPGVTVTGLVDDLRPYLEQASVFVAPLRFGAGIQNKVLEAMAMEVPVVASPVAAGGLRTESGRIPPIDVATSADEFARALARRLGSGGVRADEGARLRQFVEKHFVWQKSGAALERVLLAAAGKTPTQIFACSP